MLLFILRGTSRIVASVAGFSVLYSITYAMEGITTRMALSPLHELVETSFWVVPLSLLFCSGAEDLGKTIGRAWLFWVLAALVPLLVYHVEHNTGARPLNKISVPILAVGLGVLPHLVRRVGFLFTAFSIAFGIAGLAAVYFIVVTLLSGTHFAPKGLAFAFLFFAISSIFAGILSVASLRASAARPAP